MSTSTPDDGAGEVAALISGLCQSEREIVASEIEVLQSIYGEDTIRVWRPPAGKNGDQPTEGSIRYEIQLSLPSPHEDISVRLLVSLASTYPSSSPPQLQLLSRYIGAFGADSNLFGSILRTFISVNGVEWVPETVCVFDGIQKVLEFCADWYQDRLSKEKAGESLREDTKELNQSHSSPTLIAPDAPPEETVAISATLDALPEGLQIFVSDPITDRKSTFVGRACSISHPSEVSLILSYLMADRRIARAAHPIINAWRCQVGNTLHQDNDDDGETAAGGRLAHLLQILEMKNVLVVVTRYFGGIQLGPDRFKHINQAARNALEHGGFLDGRTGRGKRH